jgi:two-component system sensor histidine kinase EvgS
MTKSLESTGSLATIGFWLAVAGVIATAIAIGQWSPLAGLPFLAAGYVLFVLEARHHKTRLDRFFDLSLDMFCVSSKDGYFKVLNPAFSRTLGWTIEEMLARPFLHFVHPDDVAATLREVERQVAAGEPVLQFENRYRHKDGSWRVLAWRSVPQPGGYMYATARDVTEQDRVHKELVQAKEEADAATRAKSTFLATMSHEIRTPLNGVLGTLELLALTELDAEQRASLGIVHKSAESLNRIIDDILEFSKIEAGRLEIRPEITSIAGVVAAVRDTFSGNASAKGLLLEMTVDPRISPAVRVDALRLQQVLNNFVSNALKFTAVGRISIAADLVERKDGVDHVRFVVSDTGVGIAPEDRARLFQPFSQPGRHTALRPGGTGLGLTICRRLADMMGGSIDLRSVPDVGTKISLTLPLPIADAAALPAAAPATVAAPGPRRRRAPTVPEAEAARTLVLVADDHPINRLLLRRQLNVLGYAAETAEEGAAALRLWQSGRYALVIADCNMPVLDGYELARRIREAEAARGAPRTPIIACTANALSGEAATCLAAGMDDYLSKPVQLAEVAGKLARWLPLPEPAGPSEPPGQGADAPAPAAVDAAVLAELSGGDAAQMRNILQDFRRLSHEDAEQLAQAFEHSDLRGIGRLAHRIKGVSEMIGASNLGSVCARLERASRAQDWPRIRDDMAVFRREMGEFDAYVDAL